MFGLALVRTLGTGRSVLGRHVRGRDAAVDDQRGAGHEARIVTREEDAEFVECLECGEIFESSEYKDMTIEDTKLKNEF